MSFLFPTPIPQFAYPFIWTPRLFLFFYYNVQHCYKCGFANISLRPCFQSFWIYVHIHMYACISRSGIARSYGNFTFKFVFVITCYMVCAPARERKVESTLYGHGHTIIPSPPFSSQDLGHTQMPGIFFKLSSLGLEPHSQSCDIQTPSCHQLVSISLWETPKT